MANVPRPNIIWRGAHPNNFTVGRPGAGRDGRNTFHHVVGSAESAVLVFNQPTRGASSHFIVTDQPGVIYQCVDINNTAWCDGNWESNLRTISVEHHGDWRNGYNNPTVRENAALLAAWLRDQGLVNRPIRHRDVSLAGTACPSDLPVESIWDRASAIIRQYNEPVVPPMAEWQRNRREIPGKTVYAQNDGLFIRNLKDPNQAADSRRFARNQNFAVKGQTTVNGQPYYITNSSYDANIANGIAVNEVADTPYVPPTPQPIPAPPVPTTPNWEDSIIDDGNKTMYVLRATPLIDLENGRIVQVKQADGSMKEQWYQAGDIVENISAHAIVAQVTYQMTEYSFQKTSTGRYDLANGIKSSDLTVDPKATPPGTPANPTPVPEPTDPVDPMPDVPTPDPKPDGPSDYDKKQDEEIAAIRKLLNTVVEFLKGLFKNF